MVHSSPPPRWLNPHPPAAGGKRILDPPTKERSDTPPYHVDKPWFKAGDDEHSTVVEAGSVPKR